MDEQEHAKGAPGVWKRPNFGLIVAMSAVFIVLMLVGLYLFAWKDSKDLVPATRRGAAGPFVLPGAVGGAARSGAGSLLG